jgi:hypothetical protein
VTPVRLKIENLDFDNSIFSPSPLLVWLTSLLVAISEQICRGQLNDKATKQ